MQEDEKHTSIIQWTQDIENVPSGIQFKPQFKPCGIHLK